MCCQVWLLCSLTFAYRPCVSLLVNVKQRGLWAEAAAAGVPQLRKAEEGECWSQRVPSELSEGSSALDSGLSLSVESAVPPPQLPVPPRAFPQLQAPVPSKACCHLNSSGRMGGITDSFSSGAEFVTVHLRLDLSSLVRFCRFPEFLWH